MICYIRYICEISFRRVFRPAEIVVVYNCCFHFYYRQWPYRYHSLDEPTAWDELQSDGFNFRFRCRAYDTVLPHTLKGRSDRICSQSIFIHIVKCLMFNLSTFLIGIQIIASLAGSFDSLIAWPISLLTQASVSYAVVIQGVPIKTTQ